MKSKYEDLIKKLTKENDINALAREYSKFNSEYSCKPDPDKFPKYKEGDIIDEDMSVKWNREEVARRIIARNEEVTRLNTEKNFIDLLFIKAIKTVLGKKYNNTIKETEIIWGHAYDKEHSGGIASVISEFDDLADMYEDLKSFLKGE